MNPAVYREACQMVARGDARNFKQACGLIGKRPHRKRKTSTKKSMSQTFERPAYWDE